MSSHNHISKPGSNGSLAGDTSGTSSNQPSRTILHVDMDAFFVSVEQAHDPSLKGKPVIVGGRPETRHGVVCSASYEARQFGVRSGMPLAKAMRLCPNAVVISTNHKNYLMYSRKIEEILNEYSPVVEMASLDEAYVDLTGTELLHRATPPGIAQSMQKRIQQELNLPSSYGIAGSKVVAKIATDCAKPHGLLWIVPGKEREFLRPLKVEVMPGVGSRMSDLLRHHGLTTLGEVQDIGEQWMVQQFGVTGRYLYRHACGIDPSPVMAEDHVPKSVSRSYTFPRDLFAHEEIQAALSYLCEHIGIELRRLNARTASVSLSVRYADFQTISGSARLTIPINDETELLTAVWRIFERIDKRQKTVRLLGVTAGELVYAAWQRDMFKSSAREQRRQRLLSSLDEIKERYGFDSIMHGTTFPYRKPDDKK